MAVFTADHIIRPQDRFAEAVETACAAAEAHPAALLTFGVRPTWPHTGLGYIHCGEQIDDGVYRVRGFREKPERRVARTYVEDGQHFWNSGMFVWTLGAIRSALRQFLPDSIARLEPVARAAADGAGIAEALADAYPGLEKISIDYAVMEKAGEVMMVDLGCEWLDVGSWPAMENVTELDEGDNAVAARNAVLLDSSRNVVVCEDDHLLAVVGVDDCIVVHSADATLVCGKSDAQRLKELVEQLRDEYGDRYV
jgi:mannose-1-phosphate guanylyltransferase